VAAPFEDLPRLLVDADVVISSTGSPGYVLDRAMTRQAVHLRAGRPLLLIDIAVPRDIDPGAADLEGVRLYDIDDLQILSEGDAAALERDLAWAREIVGQETRNFQEWWDSLDVVPLIALLRTRAEAVRQAEVARTLARLQGQWPEDAEALASHLDGLTQALVKKLLHNPTVFLRESRDPDQQQMVRRLFNLDNLEGGTGRRGRK
jgi:glutamyl-tRNA reductase